MKPAAVYAKTSPANLWPLIVRPLWGEGPRESRPALTNLDKDCMVRDAV